MSVSGAQRGECNRSRRFPGACGIGRRARFPSESLPDAPRPCVRVPHVWRLARDFFPQCPLKLDTPRSFLNYPSLLPSVRFSNSRFPGMKALRRTACHPSRHTLGTTDGGRDTTDRWPHRRREKLKSRPMTRSNKDIVLRANTHTYKEIRFTASVSYLCVQ